MYSRGFICAHQEGSKVHFHWSLWVFRHTQAVCNVNCSLLLCHWTWTQEGVFIPGWEGNWIAWLNEPCASLGKRCRGCCIVLGSCDSLEFRPMLSFFIFLQTGLQLWFRKLHSVLLSLDSQLFSVSLVQAIVCNCLSQLEAHISESSNCEHWAIFLESFPSEKHYFI